MAELIHPFERAGLGCAPFRFAGLTENVFVAHPGAVPRAGGSCDYCSNGIRFEFWVMSGDGRRFKVGCDCIRKVEGAGSRLLATAERKLRAAKREAAAAALAARVKAAEAALADRPMLFLDKPHPAIASKTYRGYVAWLLVNGGAQGRTKACKIIEEEAGT